MLPSKLMGGEDVRYLRPWLNQLCDHIRSITPFEGSGIKIDQTPGGTRISAKPGSSVSPCAESDSDSSDPVAYMCKTTSASSSGDGYTVDVYDSYGGTKLYSATVTVPLLLFTETLPTDVWIVVPAISMTVVDDGGGVE